MPLKQTAVWKFFSSIKLAIGLLIAIAVFSIAGTLIPQNRAPADYIAMYGQDVYNILSKSGLTNMYSAGWFILLIVLLALNLIFCLLKRLSLKVYHLGILISHLSILVILAGTLVGMIWGEKGYLKLEEGEAKDFFMPDKENYCSIDLDFSLRLDDFIYEENIDPEEKLLVYSADGELLDEIPPEADKKSEIGNTGYSLKILRYVPDFVMDVSTKEVSTRSAQPRNPAIEIELEGRDKLRREWVFAAYPNMHQETEKEFRFRYQWKRRMPKDFISWVTVIKDGKEVKTKDIRVNFPLKFDGYTFFQSSYDTEHLNWTGLRVVKDPGVPLVYLGFVLLILGLCIRFYVRPLLNLKGK